MADERVTSYVAMRLDDGSWYQLRDLPWEIVTRLEREFSTSWASVLDMPWINGGLLEAVAVAVCIEKDQQPLKIRTARDAGALLDRFGAVDEHGNLIRPVSEREHLSWSATGG